MSKIYKIEYPKSYNNSAYEPFEYLIRWIGRDGSDYLYMFYDAELSIRINSTIINREDTNIQSLIEANENEVVLTANDLSRNDLTIIGQILEQKYITRIYKDGTTKRYTPDNNSFTYDLLDGRYNLKFKIVAENIKTWK